MQAIIIFISLLTVTSLAFAHGVPMSAATYIVSPKDGETLSSPVTVKFGIRNFKISPAGEDIHKAGHFHLLLNSPEPLDLDAAIPYDKHHLHFDSGENQVILTLPPGKHTLQLVVGDEEHEPFEQLVSKPVTITVK